MHSIKRRMVSDKSSTVDNKYSFCIYMQPNSQLSGIILRLRQDGCHFPDNNLKLIFVNENLLILNKISFQIVPRCPINNIPALGQIMAWRRPGAKPLSAPMIHNLLTHICVTRPQWVNHHNVILKYRSVLSQLFSEFMVQTQIHIHSWRQVEDIYLFGHELQTSQEYICHILWNVTCLCLVCVKPSVATVVSAVKHSMNMIYLLSNVTLLFCQFKVDVSRGNIILGCSLSIDLCRPYNGYTKPRPYL